MQTFTTAAALRDYLDRAPGPVAFVPTMGALHEGHLALVRAARADHPTVVCSIFVNPTQFNEAADLQAYPRTPEADAALLVSADCKVLYLPDVEDVYPTGTATSLAGQLNFGSLTTRMEGAHRPGHFAGVAQVVSRLLEIVRPATLVMGQKDYQQVAVIRSMLAQLDLAVALRAVATVREADGLAMSSRNRRLGPAERQAAPAINRHLAAIVAGLRAGWPARQLEALALEGLRRHPLLDPEYVEICHGDTLLPYTEGETSREIVVATAVRCGPVRLIDNHAVDTPFNP